MGELLQIAGAVLVLGGYAMAQAGRVDQRSYSYLLLNLIGSATLASLAAFSMQWGFLLLEGAWALISLWGVLSQLWKQPGGRRGPLPG